MSNYWSVPAAGNSPPCLPSVFPLAQNNKRVPCVCTSPARAVCKSRVITSINHSALASSGLDDPEILLPGIVLQEITRGCLTAAAKHCRKRPNHQSCPRSSFLPSPHVSPSASWELAGRVALGEFHLFVFLGFFCLFVKMLNFLDWNVFH